jgi:hypothetical protein
MMRLALRNQIGIGDSMTAIKSLMETLGKRSAMVERYSLG